MRVCWEKNYDSCAASWWARLQDKLARNGGSYVISNCVVSIVCRARTWIIDNRINLYAIITIGRAGN